MLLDARCWAILAGSLHMSTAAPFGTNLPVMVIYTRNLAIPDALSATQSTSPDLLAAMEVSQAHTRTQAAGICDAPACTASAWDLGVGV
jgi:hypothetical protein